jgi:hypothetical protein
MAEQLMKCLSVRQPWAWLIVNGYKPIENRDWPTKVRGRVLIHASKGMTRREYEDVLCFIAGRALTDKSIPMAAYRNFPRFEDVQRGGIVGAVDIVDCVTEHQSPFFFGIYGFVLANPQALPFRPCKGALGFFGVKVDLHDGYPEAR